MVAWSHGRAVARSHRRIYTQYIVSDNMIVSCCYLYCRLKKSFFLYFPFFLSQILPTIYIYIYTCVDIDMCNLSRYEYICTLSAYLWLNSVNLCQLFYIRIRCNVMLLLSLVYTLKCQLGTRQLLLFSRRSFQTIASPLRIYKNSLRIRQTNLRISFAIVDEDV